MGKLWFLKIEIYLFALVYFYFFYFLNILNPLLYGILACKIRTLFV